MITYRLELINPDPILDLKIKKDSINKVMNYILNGGRTRTSFRDVLEIKIIEILSRSILMDVQESDIRWHVAVGQRLANDHGMRHFCNPRNTYQMFRWVLVQRT